MRRKHHAHARSVFSSYQVMVQGDPSHIRHQWSYLAKCVLHLKLYWSI